MRLKITSSIAIFTLMSIAIITHAQPAQQSLRTANIPLRQTSVFTGQVTGWVSNEDFFYNGFYLQTENGKYLVKFSPRIGNKLTSAFKIGSNISINAVELPEPTDKDIIQLVNITTNGVNIYDSPPTVLAPVEEFIFGSGKINQLQENKPGDVTGFILSDNTILRMPSYAAEQLNKIALVGTYVTYSGNQILRKGEFAPVYYTIVQCKTITIDERQYLIE